MTLRRALLAIAVVALTSAAVQAIYLSQSAKLEDSAQVGPPRIGPVPKVKVDGDTMFDFGELPQRQKGTHSWTVHNDGKADLDLWIIPTGVFFRTPKLKVNAHSEAGDHVQVKPSRSTTIDLEWNTKEIEGEYRQQVTIGTNDPSRPTVPLIFKGTVYPPVVVNPNSRTIQMGSVPSDQPKMMHAILFAHDQTRLKLLRITTTRPGLVVVTPKPLSVEELKPLQIKGGYKLEVEVKPGMPLGAFREEVVIETDNKLAPEIKLTVHGTVTGPISVLPDRLRLINVTTKRGGSGEVTLLVRGGKPTKFEVAKKPERLDVAISSNETATLKGRYRLTVTVPPGTPSGQIEEMIILKTDNPKAAEVKIPVNIFVLGGAAG